MILPALSFVMLLSGLALVALSDGWEKRSKKAAGNEKENLERKGKVAGIMGCISCIAGIIAAISLFVTC